MYKILFALITILILTPLTGIENSGDNGKDIIMKEYQLPDRGREAWNAIKDDWMKNQYRSCLKKFKLSMTCAGCVYIYMKGEITIGSDKKLSSFRKTGENACGRKISSSLEKCFIDPLKEMTFPEELKDVKFETMLGTGLKC